MLATDTSRGYSLEMIPADFLAHANLQSGDPDVRLFSWDRLVKFLPSLQKAQFPDGL
jgi:hypothetical protein